LDSLLVMRIPL